MSTDLLFVKTGSEIKEAAKSKMQEIKLRLDKRNEALSAFLQDPLILRSYLVRSSKIGYSMHGGGSLWSETDISSERMEEIRQLCERVYDLEAELQRLRLIVTHLADEQEFQITYADLAGYGFKINEDT